MLKRGDKQFRRSLKTGDRKLAERRLVELLAYSGCRLDEARNLLWKDVSFERNCITITGGEKGAKDRRSARFR